MAIPVNTPLLSGNEKKYLMECIDTGWISSEGPFVSRFENEFSNYVGRKFGVAVSNGSAALDIAVQALHLTTGDEVIMPAFTIISPASSVVKQGATPVLVDSCADTWNMDVSQIEKKITNKTKAIIVVHIYGLPVDMDIVLALAKKYDLKIIEDAAEMHGQTYKGKKCGGFGDISIFSFYPNKQITTGEGGMLVCDDKVLADRCHSLKNLCFLPEKRFVHEELGWNYRMTNLQAALGVAQLENIEKHILRKREIGNLYSNLLRDLPGIDLPLKKTFAADNIYWIFGLLVNDSCKISKDEIVAKLTEKQIGTRPFFYPMHLQPVFKKMGLFKNEKYPIAERLYNNGFYIPSGLGLSNDDIKTVSDTLHNILQ
ncbi:GDP-perosamine synthase RfbE/PerA [soil metagenome]